MKTLLISFLTVFLSFSCTNKKKTIETIDAPKEVIINTEQLKKEGYIKATIKDFSNTNDGCGYLIVLNKTGQVLQPMKPLTELLQIEGFKIWIKYRPVRPIAPICKKGIPINIEGIKPRKE